MSYLTEKKNIEEFFIANWTHTPIEFENGETSLTSEYVRITIQNGDAFQVSMGDNPSFRHVGVVFVQIFTATDIGSGRALELADLVDQLFRIAVVSNIHFSVPQVKRIRNESEWFQVNVSIAFYRGS